MTNQWHSNSNVVRSPAQRNRQPKNKTGPQLVFKIIFKGVAQNNCRPKNKTTLMVLKRLVEGTGTHYSLSASIKLYVFVAFLPGSLVDSDVIFSRNMNLRDAQQHM